MNAMCEKCSQGAQGEDGHSGLAFYVEGPYPGHRIFRCGDCDERWIRHFSGEEGRGWTRYALQFATGIRQPIDAIKHGLTLAP